MGWYNANWQYRVKVTVQASKVSASLTDFPVYVDLSDLPAGFHSNVNSDGGDIRVTESDGITEVPREVVFYDDTNDKGELHFKGDLSSSVDTEFYIYYGNSGASDYAVGATYGRNAVWDSNYLAVYHLSEDPSVSVVDSTGNGKDGLGSSGMSSGNIVSGKIGKAVTFDGSHNVAITDSSGDFQKSNITISAWIKRASSQPDGGSWGIFAVGGTGPAGASALGIHSGDFEPFGHFENDTPSAINVYSGVALTIDVWEYAVMTNDGSNVKIYQNGEYKDELASGATHTGSFSARIGSWGDARYFSADIDEVRISQSDRGAAWIGTEYNNQSDTSTFFSIGSQEEAVTNVSIGDNGSVSDSIGIFNIFSLNDSGSFVEDWDLYKPRESIDIYKDLIVNKLVSETGAGVETIEEIISYVDLSDSSSALDAIAILAQLLINESVNATDFLEILNFISQDDSGSGLDNVEIFNLLSNIAETGAGSDQISILAQIIQSDSAVGSESLLVSATLEIQDVGSGSELLQILNYIPLTDSGAGSDSVSQLLAILGVNDSGIAIEVLNILNNLEISEPVTGDDLVGLLAIINQGDSGSGNESIQLLNQLSIDDLASGSEVIDLLVDVSMLDSGLVQELIGIFNQLSIDDYGLAGDLIEILNNLEVSEAGSSSDLVGVIALIAQDDSVIGDDLVSLYTAFNKLTSSLKSFELSYQLESTSIKLPNRSFVLKLDKKEIELKIKNNSIIIKK